MASTFSTPFYEYIFRLNFCLVSRKFGNRNGMDERRETYDVFQKFYVLSVGYLGKCLWLLMNCRKEKELECLNFRFFFSCCLDTENV